MLLKKKLITQLNSRSPFVIIENAGNANPYVHKLVMNIGLASSAFLKPQCS